MQEEFLNGYLLGYGAVGIAVPCHSLGLTLESCHLNIRLKYRLIAYHPNHLINYTMLGSLEVGIHSTALCRVRNGYCRCVGLRLCINHQTLATLRIGSYASTQQHSCKSYQY